MGIVIALIAVALIGACVAFAMRGRSAQVAPAARPLPEPEPMIGLESALDEATDRAGRNMRQRMAAVEGLDDLRVTDDTGPVLRRALDHVANVPAPGSRPAQPKPATPVADAPA